MSNQTPNSTPVTFAEIRLRIAYSSAYSPVTVRGGQHPHWHFFKEENGTDFLRIYRLGDVNPDEGIFPLDQARGDCADIQAGVLNGLRFRVEMLTPEEAKAEADAVEAAKREAIDDAERVREVSQRLIREAQDARARADALLNNDPHAIAELRKQCGKADTETAFILAQKLNAYAKDSENKATELGGGVVALNDAAAAGAEAEPAEHQSTPFATSGQKPDAAVSRFTRKRGPGKQTALDALEKKVGAVQ